MPLFKTAICIVLLQLYLVSYSQYRFEKAVALTADNGLPSNDIRRITKGPDGFIWIATSEGLCRYDGSRVKTYRHIPGLNSLKNNSVLDLLALEREIWIAHEEGISILDITSQKFRHYKFPDSLVAKDNVEESGAVSRLMKDTEGNIWMATRRLGLWFYDPGNSVFKTFTPPKNEKYKDEPFLGDIYGVLSIEQSRTDKNIIWAGTSAGLLIVNRSTGRMNWQPFITSDKKLQVAANAFRRLYHHNDGLVYVGTWSAGVQVFDPVANELKPLPHNDETANYILKSTVSSIIPKNENSIWITCGRGLLLYDTQEQKIIFSKINSQVNNQFYGVQFIDERQRIWNYNVDGIKYFDPVVQQADIYSYAELFGKDWAFTFHIAPAGKDSLIVCPANSDGLYTFNRYKRTWKHLPFLKDGNPLRTVVHGFVKTKKGDLFLTTNQGFFRYHPSSKKLEQVHIPVTLKYYRWNQLLTDLDDNLWLSAEGEGLVYWNRNKNNAILFPQPGVESFQNRRNLFCDSRNNIWFSTSRQVGVYIRDKNRMQLFNADKKLSLSYVTGFAEDNQKRVWASNRKGLFAFVHVDNPEAGFQPQFFMKDKGLEDYAFRITADSKGNIWGYNRDKLFAIDSTGSLDIYPFQYGIRVADFYHFSSLSSGELIFGGRSDIILADPYTFTTNTEVPQPYIESLEVLENINKEFTANTFPSELKYREKNISLSFSAIAYSMADQLKFRYRLKGLHDWVESDERRSVIYTNLKGGKYLFQVEVSNSQGQWNNAVAELPIKILSPWWQSTWFAVSSIILILGALYTIYKFRINSIRKKAKLKTEYEKRIANVELSALLAQMNPHFLFNSLNSIDSYIIRNEPKKASEYLNNFARLIRLILQNSKSNFISLKDELETLDLYLQMESLRFKNKFSYSIKVDKNIEPEKLQIPPLLIQPYVENAIWHGIMNMDYDFKGQVHIHISRHENMLICTVEDNGIGRQKAMELISQRQGPKRKSMGMQITKDRIDMINKLHNQLTTVEIIDMKDENQNAKGTKVQLVIPIN